LEAGLLKTSRCGLAAACVAVAEVLLAAAVLLGFQLFAECLQLLRLGAEAGDAGCGGFWCVSTHGHHGSGARGWVQRVPRD